MPSSALRLTPEVVAGLAELGVERVEQVLDLPRPGLATRFGDEVVRRIDQMFGEAMEVIEPVRPSAPVRVERMFDGPTTRLESVSLAVLELVEAMSCALTRREEGVRVLRLELDRVGMHGSEIVREVVTLGAPSRDVRHLWSLLRPRLEKVQMGFGIEGVSLVAHRTGGLAHRQVERWRHGTTRRDEEAAGEQLMDVLANRLGRGAVTRMELGDAHLPERGFRHVDAGLAERTDATSVHWLDRPSLLLETPEEADAIALLPDRAPSWVRWRGVGRKVRVGVGPERVGECWWDQRDSPQRARSFTESETQRRVQRQDTEPEYWPQMNTDGHRFRQKSFGVQKGREEPRTKTPKRQGKERFGIQRGERGPHAKVQRREEEASCLRASVPSCLSVRDYFRVQCEDGLWLWVFRTDHQWFVHGVWA
jgi:protein ImuB